jgi:hypothetical protein
MVVNAYVREFINEGLSDSRTHEERHHSESDLSIASTEAEWDEKEREGFEDFIREAKEAEVETSMSQVQVEYRQERFFSWVSNANTALHGV